MTVRGLLFACTLLLTSGAHGAAAASFEAADGARVLRIQTLGTDIPAPERLLRQLGLEVGARFDARRVQRSRQQILALGWLRDLEVIPSLLAPDSVSITVSARRSPPASLQPLLQIRADDRIVLGGKLRFWGGAGRGERFSLEAAGGGAKLLHLEWSEPQPLLALPLGATFHADLVQAPEEGEGGIVFDRTAVGAKLQLPPRGPRLELAGAFTQVHASEAAGLLSGSSSDRLRRGSIAFAWGARPQRFLWSYWNGQLALGATTGAAEHQDVEAKLQGAFPFSRRFVLAAGVEVRGVRGTVPRYGRLHLGSGPSLRSHSYAVANGDAGGWGGLEARIPLNFWSPESFERVALPLTLHVFADAGSAWGASAPGAVTEAAALRQARLRWGVGLGAVAHLRQTQPLRFAVGCDDEFHWRTDIGTSLSF